MSSIARRRRKLTRILALLAAVTAQAAFTTHLQRNDRPAQAGKFGDGITVVGGAADGVVWVTDSSIENSARAGLSNFGGRVALGDTIIQCAAFDLEGETLMGETFQFTDLGGQKCGCPTATGTCTAVSLGFEPPAHVMSSP
jgi:hypothetical protein